MSLGPVDLALALRLRLCRCGATSCQSLLSASSWLADTGLEALTRPARSKSAKTCCQNIFPSMAAKMSLQMRRLI